MTRRTSEGDDVAIYYIGVDDDGHKLGICEEEMTKSLNALRYGIKICDII